MKRKINNRLIGTATLAILATLLLTVAVCYNSFKGQVMEDLKGYAGIISRQVVSEQQDYLVAEQEELNKEKVRVTLIAEDGTVIFDTDADAGEMENHSNRPEVESAFTSGEGSIIRQSDTLDKNTYYYAVKLSNGQVLRIAREADSIYRIMESAVPYLLIFVVVIFSICCVFSYFLAEGIMLPIKLIASI